VLPVSGVELRLREPTGHDEVCVLESTTSANATTFVLAERLAAPLSGEPLSHATWGELPAPDLAAVALLIREAWLGPLIQTEATCPSPPCSETIDIAFTVRDYLAHSRPRHPRGVGSDERPGWYVLGDGVARFRVPTVEDLLAVDGDSDPGQALAQRCVEPADLPGSSARRVERAMAALAPSLVDTVAGECPECGEPVALLFDPANFTVAELRDVSRFVYADVHLIASRYGWPEDEILALPSRRRACYADLIRDERWIA